MGLREGGLCWLYWFGAGIWGLINVAVSLGMPAGLSSLILQSSAFFTLLAAFFIFKEKVSSIKLIGIAIAFLGFMLILFYRQSGVSLLSVLLVLGAAVFWTICNVIIKQYKPENVLSFIVWSSLLVPIPVLMFALVQHYSLYGSWDMANTFQFPSVKAWLSILFQAYVTTLLGYGVWTWAIGKYGLSNVAPFSLVVPVSGLFFGWMVYGEVLSWSSMIGALLVMFGLVLLSTPKAA